MVTSNAPARQQGPQRSELSVPATSTRFFGKAAASAADAIVLDLEDGVAVDRKDEARAEAIKALHDVDWGDRVMSVRVNSIGTPWCHQDIVAVASACPRLDRIVLPKSQEAFDIRFVAALLDGIEAARGDGKRVGIAALIETAKGVGNAETIAVSHPRLETMIFGLGDYTREMRTPDSVIGLPNPDYAIGGHINDQWHYGLARIANACRAAEIRPIGPVFADIRNTDGLAEAAKRWRALGFDGCWAIHPDQVPVINKAFSPDEARIDWARRILAALEQGAAAGAGAVKEDGQMIDAVHGLMARDILRQAGLKA